MAYRLGCATGGGNEQQKMIYEALIFAAGVATGALVIIVFLLYELTLFFGPRRPLEDEMHIPLAWRIAAVALLAVALLGAAAAYRSHVWHQGFDTAVSERAARDAVATLARVRENAVVAVKNDSINAIINKAHNETLTPVIQRIYVDRVRVGPGICGPASATKTEDASGGNGEDSPARLVRADIERDIRALKVQVEEGFAAGRACQEFGRQQGFWP